MTTANLSNSSRSSFSAHSVQHGADTAGTGTGSSTASATVRGGGVAQDLQRLKTASASALRKAQSEVDAVATELQGISASFLQKVQAEQWREKTATDQIGKLRTKLTGIQSSIDQIKEKEARVSAQPESPARVGGLSVAQQLGQLANQRKDLQEAFTAANRELNTCQADLAEAAGKLQTLPQELKEALERAKDRLDAAVAVRDAARQKHNSLIDDSADAIASKPDAADQVDRRPGNQDAAQRKKINVAEASRNAEAESQSIGDQPGRCGRVCEAIALGALVTATTILGPVPMLLVASAAQKALMGEVAPAPQEVATQVAPVMIAVAVVAGIGMAAKRLFR